MRYKRLLVIVVTVLFVPLFAFSSFAVTESQVYENGYLVNPPQINKYFSSSLSSSVSPLATSILTDWFNSPPYATDFRLPAGQDSVVVDVISNTGRYARRYVFPQGCNCFVVVNDSLNMSLVWNTDNADDVLYMYTDYDYDTGTFNVDSYSTIYPDATTGGRYAKTITYAAGSSLITVGGYVTNGLIIDTTGLGRSLAFPDAGIVEEKKTQGMISQLISDIKDWFSNLIDSMGNFFTELADKISGFFTNLGNEIGGFFTTLWNKIWWGNEAGESEYEPPNVGSKFDEVVADLNDWLSQLKGFSDTIDSQGDEVAGYLSTGSNFINTFLSVAPAPILIFLSFGVIFVVVRKVVGR